MGYTIKEVSEMTGLSISTLRYYDKMGLLPLLERKQSGYRNFTDGDIEMLKIIDSFKKAGLRSRICGVIFHWCSRGKAPCRSAMPFF